MPKVWLQHCGAFLPFPRYAHKLAPYPRSFVVIKVLEYSAGNIYYEIMTLPNSIVQDAVAGLPPGVILFLKAGLV